MQSSMQTDELRAIDPSRRSATLLAAQSFSINHAHMGIEPIDTNDPQTKSLASHSHALQPVLLSTAVIEVASDNRIYIARALLDSGSQRCFVTKSFCELINAKLIQSAHEIRGVGNSVTQCSERCELTIKSRINAYTTTIQCFVLPEITCKVPVIDNFSHKHFCIPDNIQLADPQFLQSQNIDILIGADIFWDLLTNGKIRLHNGPYLHNTLFGWVISGPIHYNSRNQFGHIQCNYSSTLDTLLRQFWELEELPKHQGARTDEEQACENHFVTTTTRNSDGRFCVCIPFKRSPEVLGDTFPQAERRFLMLERRLQRSETYKKLYSDFMHEYENMGHMTKITSYSNPHYFMPHHGVLREHSVTTKLRVVFDASATSSSGLSLNDIQRVGEPIQGDLLAILLRFRQHRYVACADVEKMYRQVLVEEQQRHLQLILWRDDPSQPLGIYRLNTVTYGTASAPFLSIRCLKQLGTESADPDVQRIIKEDFFVDDLITGDDDLTKLLYLCNETAKTLMSGCFPLRKWTFNFSQENLHASNNYNALNELSFNNNSSNKTLGIGWFNTTDELHFNTQIDFNNNNSKCITKRIILSHISQIFDPLGLISPSITQAKILLQRLWLLKIDWNDAVPDDVTRTWNRFISSLANVLNTIRVPRYVLGENHKHTLTELHIFTDASQLAYGTCIYVRTVSDDLNVSVRLLCAKGKVAPLNSVSIPRLELCGALLGARLYDKDYLPLSPAHFLVGRTLTSPACEDFTYANTLRLTRYQRVEQMRQHFWSRWMKEYVGELQIRNKWKSEIDDLKPNTLVVIKDDNLPPLKWQLGRVTRTIPGKDNITRVAEIRTNTGLIRRSCTKICPLFETD
ncbi:uncharacterized protein LOC123660203 [Melitaea cinxia]|uniref:uncharacterized protein LOC123660203 n=1 Tax=Melitaea cinxia TaxID=113334 RepID=UPI001E26F3FB|nr:uncharacterized protein LOC123660203 [Melitaea cinxia]